MTAREKRKRQKQSSIDITLGNFEPASTTYTHRSTEHDVSSTNGTVGNAKCDGGDSASAMASSHSTLSD